MTVTRDGRRNQRTPDGRGRRAVLAAVATGLIGTIGGCVDQPTFPDADVVAGPEGRPEFDPAELSVPPSTTVTWGFASPNHNVCCRPADHEEVGLPDGAEPFASYDPGESPERSRVPQGETYEHTLDVRGEYVYVCVPHATKGMTGQIRVE